MSIANLDKSQNSLKIVCMSEFNASIQFDLDDPELAKRLLDIATRLKMRGDFGRVSYGAAMRRRAAHI